MWYNMGVLYMTRYNLSAEYLYLRITICDHDMGNPEQKFIIGGVGNVWYLCFEFEFALFMVS